jgi:hypothetical protein
MRNGSKKLIELVLILVFLTSLSCIVLTRAEPTIGIRTSGKIMNQTSFTDHTGETHSASYGGDFSAEIVELDIENGVYVIFQVTSTDRYEMLDVHDGGWSKYDYSSVVNMESAYHSIIEDNGEYEDVLPFGSDPLVRYDGSIDIPSYGDYTVFVADPEAFFEEFKSNAQDSFGTFSPIDWQRAYYDRNGVEKTISGTAQLNDSSIEVKGAKLEMNFQLSEALDRYTFFKGLDNIPTIIDCSYKLILEYEESGLIKFYSYELTFDAGENGKITRLSSIGGASSAASAITPSLNWLLGTFVISTVVIVRKRKSE